MSPGAPQHPDLPRFRQVTTLDPPCPPCRCGTARCRGSQHLRRNGTSNSSAVLRGIPRDLTPRQVIVRIALVAHGPPSRLPLMTRSAIIDTPLCRLRPGRAANAFTYAKHTRPGGARSRIGGGPRTWNPFDRPWAATASTCPIASWPVCPFALPRARPTWRRWPRRPTTGEPTAQLLTEATRRVFRAGNRDIPGPVVRRVAQPRQDRGARGPRPRAHPLCASEGATRSLPPHPSRPTADLAAVGQPVLIPGTIGTASYVLARVPDDPAFFSTAHGAGRVQSRHQAARHPTLTRYAEASRNPASSSAAAPQGTRREKPGAYKDIDAVIETSHQARLARKVAALCPWES